jgi:hypothetical protein
VKSEKLDQIAAALCKFQKSVKGATKSSTAKIPTKSGGSYEYNYADLEAVWETARCDDLLSECGLSICQPMGYIPMGDDAADTLITLLLHSSGQWIQGETVLRLKSNDAQAQGSAITYIRRYAMCAILGIAQVDDDGAAATQHARERSQEPDMPPCPECKKPLRKSKNNPGEYYCWKQTKGCGWSGVLEGSSESTNPKAQSASGVEKSASTQSVAKQPEQEQQQPKPHVPKDGADAPPHDTEWAELKRVGLENKWPEALMKMMIDNRKRSGKSNRDIFNEMWEKFSKFNQRAVEEGDEQKHDDLMAEAESIGM